MFIGFIAVIVVLLIIVAVMSTGTTTGSGGVDQTKAAKMVTEMSALAQTAGFYKTTTVDNDYAGVDVDALVASGIVSSDDIVVADVLTNALIQSDAKATAVVNAANMISSKAVSGLSYVVEPTTALNGIVVSTAGSAAIEGTLAAALEKAYAKFGTGAAIATAAIEGQVAETAEVAGVGSVVFK